MLMDAAVADDLDNDHMDKDKTVELLRLLSTDLLELADAIDVSVDPDSDEGVRELWDDVSETMNSVFAVMASEEQFDARMEELVEQKQRKEPELSREEAEEMVLKDMDGDENEETAEE